MPVPQLHFSAIDCLSRCGEQFRRRYIDKEIRPPGIALVVGTATHRSVQQNLAAKLATGELLDVTACEDAARDALNAEWDKTGVALEPDDAVAGEAAARGDAVDKAVRLAGLHRREKAPTLSPTHVERAFVLDFTGYPLSLAGTIDIQEGAACIRDTKTSKRSPAADAAETSDQLTVYALGVKVLDGGFPAKVALDYLVDLKREQKAVTIESTRALADCEPLMRRIETAVEAMEKGVFVPARSSDWCCDPRYCGYYRDCRYVRRPATVSLTVNGESK